MGEPERECRAFASSPTTYAGVKQMSKGKRVQRDWPAVLASHLASGLSVAGFCRQERIAESLFYSWRQRCAPGTPSMAADAEGFVELQPVDRPSSTTGVTMVYDDGWRVELALDFDTATLQRVLCCIVAGAACSP